MSQKSNVLSTTSTTPGTAVGMHRNDVLDDTKDSDAKDVRVLTEEVKHIAGDVAGAARKTAEIQLTGGKRRAAKELGSVAEALHTTGDHLRERNKEELADYVVRAANQVEAASGYLQDRTMGEMVADVEQFARREPALFLGGAFAIGLVGGRFLKSARPQPMLTHGDSGARGDQGQSPRQRLSQGHGNGRHEEDFRADSPRRESSTAIAGPVGDEAALPSRLSSPNRSASPGQEASKVRSEGGAKRPGAV